MQKNINLAAKLVDGGKIYIPELKIEVDSQGQGAKDSQVQETKININTASIAKLDKLWGIGEATAKKIIEARPYQKIEELLEKKIVKSNVWEQIKDKITVY